MTEINTFARAQSNAQTGAIAQGSEAPMITLAFATWLAAAVLSTSFLSGIFGMAGGMILMGILFVIMPLPAAMCCMG
jgi:hypothetical protein